MRYVRFQVSPVERKFGRTTAHMAGLSPRRPGFNPGPVHVGFWGVQAGSMTGFSPST
jgi:hypothetical protein